MKLDDRQRSLLGESIKSAPGTDDEVRSAILDFLSRKWRKGGAV